MSNAEFADAEFLRILDNLEKDVIVAMRATDPDALADVKKVFAEYRKANNEKEPD